MAIKRFHVVTRYRIDATTDELLAAFRDLELVCRWRPKTFLDVTVDSYDPARIDQLIEGRGRGWLPYAFRFRVHAHQPTDAPQLIFKVGGDVEGEGTCTAYPATEGLDLELDWDVRILRRSFRILLRPLRRLFLSNHEWIGAAAMDCVFREIAWRRSGGGAPAGPVRTPDTGPPWLPRRAGPRPAEVRVL